MRGTHCRYAKSSPLNRYCDAPFEGGNDARTKDETRNIMNLIRNYRNWRRYRDTVNELSRLSNRELTDLGISRAEIVTVAQRAL
jgi:uncharacterized protein YjiS (DUF1127 family)